MALHAGNIVKFSIFDFFFCPFPLCTSVSPALSAWEGDRSQHRWSSELPYLLQSCWLQSSSWAVWEMRHVHGHACSFLPARHTCCGRLLAPCSTKYHRLLTQVWLAFLQRKSQVFFSLPLNLKKSPFWSCFPLHISPDKGLSSSSPVLLCCNYFCLLYWNSLFWACTLALVRARVWTVSTDGGLPQTPTNSRK